MRDERGITLISLVITIIVLLIIAGTATYSGMESINKSLKIAFISEMETIQSKVNNIYEKGKLSQEDKEYYENLGQELSVVESQTLSKILGNSTPDGFRYFSTEDLKNLELDNITQNVIINFDTREVISINGIKIDETIYYKLKDIPNYTGYNVDYVEKDRQAPSFDVDIIQLENTWKFIVKNIVDNSNADGGTVSYKLHNDENWIIIEDHLSFEVDRPGLYDIRFTDKAGNSTAIQKFINYDYVTNGVIAYYDAENNTGNGHNSTTTIWKDLSGNNNDATLTGFNNTSSSGWQEKCIQVDGDNDTINFPVEIDEAGTFSIELVFKEKNHQKMRNFTCR